MKDQKINQIKRLYNVNYTHINKNICYYMLNFAFIQTLRRLAQNREAARKSRLRKKVQAFFYSINRTKLFLLYEIWLLIFKSVFPFNQAYVQQLESSRLKLTQLEQELQRARQQVRFCYFICHSKSEA